MRHQAIYVADPEGRIDFWAADSRAVECLTFGQRTASYLVCRHCGAFMGAQLAPWFGDFGIVNACHLRLPPDQLEPALDVDFDRETREERIARRRRTWTPLARRIFDLPVGARP